MTANRCRRGLIVSASHGDTDHLNAGRLWAWGNGQVRSGRYTDAGECLCDLVQTDRQANQQIDGLLLAGLDSGGSVRPGPGHWTAKKLGLGARLGQS